MYAIRSYYENNERHLELFGKSAEKVALLGSDKGCVDNDRDTGTQHLVRQIPQAGIGVCKGLVTVDTATKWRFALCRRRKPVQPLPFNIGTKMDRAKGFGQLRAESYNFV